MQVDNQPTPSPSPTQSAPAPSSPPPRKSSNFFTMLLVALLALLLGAFAVYFYLTNIAPPTSPGQGVVIPSVPPVSSPAPCTEDARVCPDGTVVVRVGPDCEFAPCPSVAPATPSASIHPGWQVYTNQEYGFEISYPDTYQALDDAENLYGWPDAVVLLYKGGQSYDLAVEVWVSEAYYQDKYSSRMSSVTVKQLGDKYITLLNNNNDPEVAEIIATFKAI